MPRFPRPAVAAAVLGGLLVPVASACMWDHDTIKMERQRFPDTLELITGKFLRHSPEFYRWRIDDRLKRLESDPANAALLDDLAVAYDKTGQHEKAIETARRTEALHPGRYETAANLATFLFHAGRIEESIPHIDRALAINPDAHFGRERYQKHLAEYVVERRKDGPLKLPLADVTVYPGDVSAPEASFIDTFYDHLRRDRESFTRNDIAAGVKGVLGMMRFANHDSPVLLEALGTLLLQKGYSPTVDAKLLACRAFLKASYEVPDGPARVAYRGMANRAIVMQTAGGGHNQVSLEQVEADFQRELDDARAWYAEVHERELGWIRDGQNPETEFERLYYADPQVPGLDVEDPTKSRERLKWLLVAGGVATLAAVAAAVAIRRGLRRARRGASTGRPIEPEGSAAD